MIKLIASDLDGTIIDNLKDIIKISKIHTNIVHFLIIVLTSFLFTVYFNGIITPL